MATDSRGRRAALAGLLRVEPLPRVAADPRARVCHLVGGAPRDRLLGLPIRDFDLVVESRGDELATRLASALGARRVDLGGERFASFRLVGDGFTLDLWDRQGAPLEADLERRDFTVNSIAVALDGGAVEDPRGGLADLEARLLRANTAHGLLEDPLRVLRLARLATGAVRFAVEAGTFELARAAAPGLAAVARERVRDELERLLAAPVAAPAVGLLAELGLYPALWLGREAEIAPPAAALDRLDAALAAVFGAAGAGAPPALEARLARTALLFAELEAAGAGEAGELLRRCRGRGLVSGREARSAAELLAAGSLPGDELARRRFLALHGERWRTAAALAAARGGGPDAARDPALAALEGLAAAAGHELFDPRPLLDGDEVQALTGISPGPRLGELLRRLAAAQVDGAVRTRREAQRLVRELAREQEGGG